MTRHKLQDTIDRYSQQVKKHPRFREAIQHHYDHLLITYKKQPLFYKTILQSSRFHVVLALLCFHYGDRRAVLADIKEFCVKMELTSLNTVNSLVTLLRITGRMTLEKSEDDRRVLLYSPSVKGLNETRSYMQISIPSLKFLLPENTLPFHALEDENTFANFFRRSANLLFDEVILSRLVPNSAMFVDKDAGHIIMLRIYLGAKQDDNGRWWLKPNYNKTSKDLFVSRMHLRRIVNCGIMAGLFSEDSEGTLEIHRAFMETAESYFGYYFSFIMYGLDIDPTIF
ncbi:hypothetical protein RJE46_12305 [Cedecea neteri]|uniref:hypothetical protein n=1 Tax=Cedecea neteri TaxID=158822 RepID=UPI002892BEAA|nr:hypothetical protein [Cedecea neteri]WNJ77427.1 hypothetical protein RJE46_12305 [Cedecea neteri]